MTNDFNKYAVGHLGINPGVLADYQRHMEKNVAVPTSDYMNPRWMSSRAS